MALALTSTVPGVESRPSLDPSAEYVARAAKLEGKKDPKGWLALADFAEDSGLPEKRTEALKKAIKLKPDEPDAHRRLDEKQWGKEWLPAEEAEAAEEAEMTAKGLVFYGTKWIQSKEAAKHRAADRKLVGWDCDYRLETPNFIIYSDRALAFTWKIADLLENEVILYRRLYGDIWKLPPKLTTRLRVFIFKNREGFVKRGVLAYGGDIPPAFTGFYAPNEETLFVGESKTVVTDDAKCTTAVHEGLHALDAVFANVYGLMVERMICLAEGRAEYFGLSVNGRQVIPRSVNIPFGCTTLWRLGEGLETQRVSELMEMDRQEFFGKSSITHYALSWAWTHFLFHGEGGKHAAAFKDFLCALGPDSKTKYSRDLFSKIVGKPEDLTPPFREYVKKELLSRK